MGIVVVAVVDLKTPNNVPVQIAASALLDPSSGSNIAT
jgi:hypothetical protein